MLVRAPLVCSLDTRVLDVTHPCREHVRIVFSAADIPLSAPGQFLQLLCRGESADHERVCDWPIDGAPALQAPWRNGPYPFTRRPFSIADRWVENGQSCMSVISRGVGRGTQWLDRLQPGATLNITGPLGRGFAAPSRTSSLALVGGGVGIPPLLYMSRWLHEQGWRDVMLILGVTSRELLPAPVLEEPASNGIARCDLPGGAPFGTIICTDDGSLGIRGTVVDGLTAWRAAQSGEGAVMACGPHGMLKAVAQFTRREGLSCELCVERTMGCGLGTCLSCVIRLRDASRPDGWRWGMACREGPVFSRDALFDDA